MSYKIKERVVNVVHVVDCKRNKGCGPACIREKDGWVVDYEIMFPNTRYPVRKRQQIPTGWADTDRKREQWAREREAFLISKGRDAEAAQTGVTVKKLAVKFLAQRRGEGLDTEKDQQRLEDHILPVVGGVRVSEFRPKHAHQLVSKLKQTPSVRGGNLASGTIRAIYFLLKQLFQYALLEELVVGNPVVLGRGVLPKKVDKDPSWRKGAVFTRDEVELLISSDKIPFHRRVIYAIAFLTGLRPGQVFELRFGDYEPTFQPLGRLSSSRSWNSWKKKVKSTKTGVDHLVPVHPVLAKILAEWKLRGWPERHGRTPAARRPDRPDDQRHAAGRPKALDGLPRGPGRARTPSAPAVRRPADLHVPRAERRGLEGPGEADHPPAAVGGLRRVRDAVVGGALRRRGVRPGGGEGW
ncbi:MAG: hypothetical protein IPO09_16695 [Anaeromyxobacter sp.]|nr:hypothetical protein [Anaeromyxobacter sp.]